LLRSAAGLRGLADAHRDGRRVVRELEQLSEIVAFTFVELDADTRRVIGDVIRVEHAVQYEHAFIRYAAWTAVLRNLQLAL
jgi:hypothetical protein